LIESRLQPSSEEVAGHYDELDHFYREIWGEHVHHGLWLRPDDAPEKATRQLVNLVAHHARVKAGSRVCDAGCGYGATARIFARELGAQVTGITLSPAQFDFAMRFAPGSSNPAYLLGDWLKNPLPDESFDSVIAVESSEHMPDKAAFFSQACRLVRPGGRLVICSWLAKEGASDWENRFLLEPICREGRMPGIGTANEYKRFFAAAGFALEHYEDLSARVKKTWPVCAWRFVANLARKPRVCADGFQDLARI
jgi:tocopherol O-methyltransferase